MEWTRCMGLAESPEFQTRCIGLVAILDGTIGDEDIGNTPILDAVLREFAYDPEQAAAALVVLALHLRRMMMEVASENGWEFEQYLQTVALAFANPTS